MDRAASSKRKTAYQVSVSLEGIIDPLYAMRTEDMKSIAYNSPGVFDAIIHAFRYGYIKGQRAEKARQRKAKKLSQKRIEGEVKIDG